MASFADLPGELIMRIARFSPHPCAVIMRGLYDDDDEWCYWLERRAEMNDRLRQIALEEEWGRHCEHQEAKRRRLNTPSDMQTALAAMMQECEEARQQYGYYD
jgi:hypothetical protein